MITKDDEITKDIKTTPQPFCTRCNNKGFYLFGPQGKKKAIYCKCPRGLIKKVEWGNH